MAETETTGQGPAVAAETDPNGKALAAALTVWTVRELAARFIKRMRDRGLNPTIATRPDGLPGITFRKLVSTTPDPTGDDLAELLKLRPHVLAELQGDPDPVVDRLEPDAVKPSRQIPEPKRIEVRAILRQLSGNPDSSIEATACRALADSLDDHKPESLALFLGLAGDVRRGELAEGCLQEAFDAACGRKVGNRGAMFTKVVKAFIRQARAGRGDRSGGGR